MGTEGLPDPVRDRLAEHVASIIRRSVIPARDRDEVAEELLGHLESRYAAAEAMGLSLDSAASQAIAGFGGADEIGRAFVDVYHGRLWASTIGQLLPVASFAGEPPAVVVWIARFDRAMAILSVVVAIALLLTAPPVRATVGLTLGVLVAGVLWLAAIALRRGQGWAIAVSAFALLVNALIFFASLGQPPGGWTVSINGLIGLVLLIWLVGDLGSVSGWVAESTPLRGRLGWPIGIAVIGWSLMAGFAPSLPDPTQIGPADIDATATVSCAVAPSDDGVPRIPSPTVVLAVAYHRVDLAPRGILRDPTSWGDTIEVVVDPGDIAFLAVTAVTTDAAGQTVPVDVSNLVEPDLGSISTVNDLMFGVNRRDGQLVVGEILGIDQHVGRPIRITIPTVTNIGDGRPAAEIGTPVDGMSVQVQLSHLGRFVLLADVPCGGQKKLDDVSVH